MKKNNPVIKAFKGFFSSIKDDLVDLFKQHKFKLLGFVISYVLPLAFIVTAYWEKKPEHWTLPAFVWIPSIVLIFVYWAKLKSYLAIRVTKMETENALQKGKHAGAIITCKTIQLLFTVAPFIIGYFIFKAIREVIGNVESLFLIIGIMIAVGGLFTLFDTIKSVVDYEETVESTKEEEKSDE